MWWVIGLVRSSAYLRYALVALAGGLGLWRWLLAHDAAVAEAARQGYVTQVTLEAMQARLDEETRQHRAVQEALEAYRRAVADADKASDDANAKLEQAIRTDTGDGCTWTADDLEWLRRH